MPRDNPLWDALVSSDVKKQLDDRIFAFEHGGYDYVVEIKERYDYEILSRKRKKNIHDR